MTVSNGSLIMLADALRQRRTVLGTKGRRLEPGRQALLLVAHLHKGETYANLARGFAIGTTMVFCYLRDGIAVLAALAPTLNQGIAVATGKAFVVLDWTLLRIDRVGMTGATIGLTTRAAQVSRGERAGLWTRADDLPLTRRPMPGR